MRRATAAAFGVYLLGNLFFTILSRDMGSGTYLELRPLQSYVRMFRTVETDFENVSGLFALLFQDITGWAGIVLNILLYLPMGYLLTMLFPRRRAWQIILVGCLCSVATEVAQYVLAIGWCEMDDLLHNTLGTALGVQLLRWQRRRMQLT